MSEINAETAKAEIKNPRWLLFLEKINEQILDIYNKKAKAAAEASAVLVGILSKVLGEDKRTAKWSSESSNIESYFKGVDIKKDKKPTFAQWIAMLEKKKILISPFTFWSFIFTYIEDEQKLPEGIKGIIEKLDSKLSENDIAETAKGLSSVLPYLAIDNKKVITDMWIQNIADINTLDLDSSCWQLFEQIMRYKNQNFKTIQATIDQILTKKSNDNTSGLHKAAIRNMLYFIRPDLTFVAGSSQHKFQITGIIPKPAYWGTAPLYYISQLKQKLKTENDFAPFTEPPCGGNAGKTFLQWKEKEVCNSKLHYEIIAGTQTEKKDDKPYKIYAEFHIEPNVKIPENTFAILKNAVKDKKQMSLREEWRQKKNGFAIRSGDGVFVLDENGNGRDIEAVKEELSNQINALYETLDGIISQFDNEFVLSELLESSKQVILTGAPGTGKTSLATAVAKKWTKNGGEYKKVQFHPGYDYSDFIIGLKPKVEKGQVTFKWQNGVFKEFADKALKAYQQAEETAKGQAEKTKDKEINAKPYIFIIDEINRADLSRVFGEVFSLLEENYRYPNKEKGITLPSKDNFILPPNLYIIGTMNDIDRSVESMDFALRRRFSWKEVTAESSDSIIEAKGKDGNFKIANENHRSALQQAMAELNKYIGGEELEIDKQKVSLNLGTEYQLGGAYFLNFAKYQKESNPFESLWNNHIAIILNEYLRGRSNRAQILSALKGKYDAARKSKSNEKNESSADNADVETTSSSTASENKTAEENK